MGEYPARPRGQRQETFPVSTEWVPCFQKWSTPATGAERGFGGMVPLGVLGPEASKQPRQYMKAYLPTTVTRFESVRLVRTNDKAGNQWAAFVFYQCRLAQPHEPHVSVAHRRQRAEAQRSASPVGPESLGYWGLV